MPAMMPLAMKAVFAASTRRFGAERGYQAGFAIYWGTCWTLAGVIVGRSSVGGYPNRCCPHPVRPPPWSS